MCEEFTVPRSVSAQEMARLDRPVRGSIRAVGAGLWTVREADGQQLVLDTGMAVRARFDPPEAIGDEYQFDVDGELRYAVFAGTERTVVVDADGVVRRRIEHAAFTSADGAAVPADARFSADGRWLHAFVARDGGLPAERVTVSTADWSVAGRAATVCRGTDVTAHPDGTGFGYTAFDGHEFDGVWAEWVDGTETVTMRGDWRSPVPSPDGDGWLTHNWGCLYAGKGAEVLRSFEVDAEAFCGDDDCEAEVPELDFVTAVHLDRDTALCAVRLDDEPVHLLFGIDPLLPAARVAYPAGVGAGRRIASHGGGVWVSVGRDGVLRSWALATREDAHV